MIMCPLISHPPIPSFFGVYSAQLVTPPQPTPTMLRKNNENKFIFCDIFVDLGFVKQLFLLELMDVGSMKIDIERNQD